MQEDTNAVPTNNCVRILLQNNLKIVLHEDTNAVVSGNRVCISCFLGLPLFPSRVPSVPLFPFAIAFSSSSSFLATTSLSSLSLFDIWTSLSAVLLSRPPPPRRGASVATTTTSKCFRGHPHHHVSLSLFDIFFFYRRDAHHHWRLSLSLPSFNFLYSHRSANSEGVFCVPGDITKVSY